MCVFFIADRKKTLNIQFFYHNSGIVKHQVYDVIYSCYVYFVDSRSSGSSWERDLENGPQPPKHLAEGQLAEADRHGLHGRDLSLHHEVGEGQPPRLCPGTTPVHARTPEYNAGKCKFSWRICLSLLPKRKDLWLHMLVNGTEVLINYGMFEKFLCSPTNTRKCVLISRCAKLMYIHLLI